MLDGGYYKKLITEIEDTSSPTTSQLIYKAKALRLLGKNNMALRLLNSLDVTSDLHITIQSLRERGHILLELGYYDTAEKMINESFEILSIIRNDKDEIQNIKADIMHTSGNLLSHKGDFQNALNYWEESLLIKNKLGKTIEQVILQNNIAIYYFVVEEYEKALDIFYEALDMINPYGITKTMTGILLNIGDTYFHIGDIDKALLYVHQSLEMTENTSLDYIKSNCYLSLLQYYLIKNDLTQTSLYYVNLLDSTFEIDAAYIDLFEKYAKALILKSSDIKADRKKAKLHFQQLLEMSEFDFQLFSNVTLNLVDILLDELYNSGDQIELDKLTNLIDEFYEVAQAKQLFHYMIDALLLKSKIEAINDKITHSNFQMEQALMIADDNQFTALKRKILVEQKKLREKIQKCNESPIKILTLQGRMDLCEIKTYVRSELTHI